jgi:hypothetical protein
VNCEEGCTLLGTRTLARRASVETRRPKPERVAAMVGELKPAGAVVTVPVLVAALRRETGCSRATAYRAVSDALASGEIKRASTS